MIANWKDWIAAFDMACGTDDWAPLAAYLTEDVVYLVAGAPFACELRGRDAVIAGLQKSVRGFDHKFDPRVWEGVGIKVWGAEAVTARAKGTYRIAGKPALSFAANGSWYFRGAQICLMTDIYDLSEVDSMDALNWLGLHGAGMDPSYV